MDDIVIRLRHSMTSADDILGARRHLCSLAADEIERLRAENGRLRGGLTLRQPPVVPRPFKPEP